MRTTFSQSKYGQRRMLIFVFFCLPLLPGCALFGGGGSDLQRAKSYKVEAPSQWHRAEEKGESDRTYNLKSGGVVTLTSSCNRGAGNSAEVLTRQLLIGARNVRYDKRQRIIIDGKDGLLSSIRATLDGVPFHLEIAVLPAVPCVFDFSMMNPRPISEGDKSEFMDFVKSFEHGSN